MSWGVLLRVSPFGNGDEEGIVLVEPMPAVLYAH
jgi:hypothetical protein